MPTRIGNVAKGSILEKFDEYINGPDNGHGPAERRARADKIKQELEDGGDLVQSAIDVGIPLTAEEQEHLNRDWLNKTQQGWWPNHPVEKELRQGFIDSARAVKETGKPVDHYWISTGEKVEMFPEPGPVQVTTLILTPPPPSPAPA
jgi:hypothetical protein